MSIVKVLIYASLTLPFSAFVQAHAQDGSVEFRLVAATGNLAQCSSMDASLSRVHTFTVNGDKAKIKSSGGIDDNMKQTSPKVYKTTFSLGGVRLEVVADMSQTPRTLDVAEVARGCRWNAVAQ